MLDKEGVVEGGLICPLLMGTFVMRGLFPSTVMPRPLVVKATEVVVGVSNPESMEVSEDEEFRGRLMGSSMGAALYVQGLWVIGAVTNTTKLMVSVVSCIDELIRK